MATKSSTTAPPPLSFSSTPLFGGAIFANLPSAFFDSSTIREVPDNQEVYLDRTGPSSIIIDLGARVEEEGVATDLEAFAFHIEDVADPKDRLCVGSFAPAPVRSLPGVPAWGTVAMTKPSGVAEDEGAEGESGVKFTVVWILLVRLMEKKTDIVITVNVPFEGNGVVVKDPWAEQKVEEIERGEQIVRVLQESFQIRDWDLFVKE